MPDTRGFQFDNSYARLPAHFYERTGPVAVMTPLMRVWNEPLAQALGITQGDDAAEIFSGNRLPPGAEPIAQAYAGHQYGHFTMLGDGRAHLLGEHQTPKGQRVDIQLKGSGPTVFSRRGDGRAALGPMLREYIISEAMHALGIPTTRSLAVVTTGQPVLRDTMLQGAILTRVAASHIRVGTFEYLAAKRDGEGLRALADYVIARHHPELVSQENRYFLLLEAVMERQAYLIARWMAAGFIHGVMNTDNMAISGETIDYGPCAFMDRYDPATVFSSIDRQGRYAYGNQPVIAQWNLSRFAEAILPLLHAEQAQAIEYAETAIEEFPQHYARHWLAVMRPKFGLFGEEESDAGLITQFLSLLQQESRDYTNSFRALDPEKSVFDSVKGQAWHAAWQARLARNPKPLKSARCLMGAHNPAVIPRNHRVEAALSAAEEGDFSVMERLVRVLRRPFDTPPDESFTALPTPSERVYQTFCGT